MSAFALPLKSMFSFLASKLGALPWLSPSCESARGKLPGSSELQHKKHFHLQKICGQIIQIKKEQTCLISQLLGS